MAITIRKATIEDYDQLSEIFSEVDEQHRLALPYFFQATQGPARSLERIQTLITEPHMTLLVAEDNHQLLGLVVVEIKETPPINIIIPRLYAVIDSLVVKETARGNGLGKILVTAAETWAMDQGVTDIQLGVYAFNEQAIDIYKHLGYETMQLKMRKDLSAKKFQK